MKDVDTANNAMGVLGVLEQMVRVLGFYDLSSFFAVSVFLLIFIAFVISCAVFLIKKRRERRLELERVVFEAQKVVKAKNDEELLKPVDSARAQEKISVPIPNKEETKKPPTEKTIDRPDVKPKIEIKESFDEKKSLDSITVIEPNKPAIPDEKIELGAALKNTRAGFLAKVARIFSRGTEISDEDFEELEGILFTADIGVKTAQKLLDVLKTRVREEKTKDQMSMRTILKEEMCKILESGKMSSTQSPSAPQVVMFVGVNGAGKTTSIGKLGAQLKRSGKTVLFGAGDTFRAAAVEQLSIWGDRIGALVVKGKENADSASVLFEAIEQAKKDKSDYVLCDTAGRLHTKVSLMDELKKVHRVLGKAQSGAPHEVFLVIDATMGQNAINQAREFANAAPLTGVILSKLDGTAKGGVALGIVDELKVPIRYVGIGEKETDLREFDAQLFVDALFLEA